MIWSLLFPWYYRKQYPPKCIVFEAKQRSEINSLSDCIQLLVTRSAYELEIAKLILPHYPDPLKPVIVMQPTDSLVWTLDFDC